MAHSLAEDETTLYHGTKSKLKDRIQQTEKPVISNNLKSALIIELSPTAVFRLAETPSVHSFHDFAVLVYHHIKDLAHDYQRVDVVCDRYFNDSLKEQIRTQRGVGTRLHFSDDTQFPYTFRSNFLHNSENKNELNEYLANKLISFHNNHQILIVSYKSGVLCSNINLEPSSKILNCTSEEADPRLVRHTRDALLKDYSFVMVRTIDTDVLVLLISFTFRGDIPNGSVYAALRCSSDSNVKYFSINDIVRELGDDVTRALPFFYAFTGCDTTSSIFNKGKCKCWDVWQNYEKEVDITSTFLSLGSLPHRVADYQINTLEYYIIILYSSIP